ncbi:hypothetical protein G5V58_08025 [Nocardioides anomalus]|uniref:Uncharacterized protein n=2 Tax=Nocardioides anomalus TaxID=2712223 RepID=A0A6G6WC55_9ACTN|nr:hypothetical protein G5V58_08025 [Nocardioides anomalus]
MLDPAKYLIVRARLAAWRDVLVERGAACDVEITGVAPMIEAAPPERVARWEPTAPGALPLTLGYRGVEGVAENIVDLGVGDPPVWIDASPHCGCDACDEGSGQLLTELDDVVEHVVSGDLVRVDGDGGHAQTTFRGASWNLPDGEALLRAAGRTPLPGYRVSIGAPWL